MPGHLQLFAGSASHDLAKSIAYEFGTELGALELQRFKDGEMQPRYGESVRGNDLFLIQSTVPPSDNIMELLLMIDAAFRASARSITVVIPYFGYARQDRKDRPRVSIGAKLLAELLAASGAGRVVTMDLHAGQIQGFFDFPLDNLNANAVFIPHLREMGLENLTMAAPDLGGITRARPYAKHLGGELLLVNKYRSEANQVDEIQLIGNVEDRNVVIVDDIADTAGTLCRAAHEIKNRGARSVRAFITHPLLSGDAIDKIEASPLEEVVVTDTIPLSVQSDKLKVLTISPIFAKALKKIYNYESVSSLFLN
jgi:ribose-phosphate pyrophosphokinase